MRCEVSVVLCLTLLVLLPEGGRALQRYPEEEYEGDETLSRRDLERALQDVRTQMDLQLEAMRQEIQNLRSDVSRVQSPPSSSSSSGSGSGEESRNEAAVLRWVRGAVSELRSEVESEMRAASNESRERARREASQRAQDELLHKDLQAARDEISTLREEVERGAAETQRLQQDLRAAEQHAQSTAETCARLSQQVEMVSPSPEPSQQRSRQSSRRDAELEPRLRRVEKKIKSALWQRARLAQLVARLDKVEHAAQEQHVAEEPASPRQGSALLALDRLHRDYRRIVHSLPRDCSEVGGASGEYLLAPGAAPEEGAGEEGAVQSWCDQEAGAGGWTLLQRRTGSSEHEDQFDRTWQEYEQGFGHTAGDFWLGNQWLRRLSADNCSSLRVDITDIYGASWFAEYTEFAVGPASDGYRLYVSGYQGNASDAMSYQNGMEFSAPDRDRDASQTHCAKSYGGGWWFSHCQHANLNGRYSLGLTWFQAEHQEWIAVASSEIKIRPRADCPR